ncbi:hypothetical protein PsorP6_014709 [Peronosclerospora sorghi]|uniref:Uncharacterized protein n=1 Tax=Peronosclerospora sorghi TaxID=230839 RepID=A0ACC0VR09_9STRA|nr:hypothetical protein PsorP6_014709 [Peronosclerospora sorghi]
MMWVIKKRPEETPTKYLHSFNVAGLGANLLIIDVQSAAMLNTALSGLGQWELTDQLTRV